MSAYTSADDNDYEVPQDGHPLVDHGSKAHRQLSSHENVVLSNSSSVTSTFSRADSEGAFELEDDSQYAEPQKPWVEPDEGTYYLPQQEVKPRQPSAGLVRSSISQSSVRTTRSRRSSTGMQERSHSDAKLCKIPSFEPPSFDDLVHRDGANVMTSMQSSRGVSRMHSMGSMGSVESSGASRVQKLPFFWGEAKKIQLECVLSQQPYGTFLIRKSSVQDNYALTGITKKYGIRHYVFKEEMYHGQMSISVEINREPRVFASIWEMVDKFNMEHVVNLKRTLNYNPALLNNLCKGACKCTPTNGPPRV